MIKYGVNDISKTRSPLPVTIDKNKYTFDYPCESASDCTDYFIKFYPGKYKIEAYGASGGTSKERVSSYRLPTGGCISDDDVKKVNGNTICYQRGSIGGAGGYVSGTILLKKLTFAYATIGGKGIFGGRPHLYDSDECFYPENMIIGGYGGGGKSANHPDGSGSGGGQTALKFVKNDLWHRVLVGGGGGCDTIDGDYGEYDDGSGGAGGGKVAQGWFKSSVYNGNYVANSTFGFTFGSGESARRHGSRNENGVHLYNEYSDIVGAGGGWFGGFSSMDYNSGSGGGSSWILEKDAIIPPDNITAHDDFYNPIDTQPYAFQKTGQYLFEDAKYVSGVWEGNGRLVVSILEQIPITDKVSYKNKFYIPFAMIYLGLC
ncbi:hypothetical protein TVAG_114200 [Trichomonas vaginalis G3]|uniref:receptor protein-tyrosine kinase n=1 Tax=Trichomonas vaginalis (strain ATCC PRA-98 / G3) TaxID=412133 RepID=A2F3U7_TRIV3|nr:glycine-rich protein family [Trichomonas vaginalis G3]EAY00416.1 hypothetical protein TVAG_114200 [Trichomonas vaginalis G3]KAI5526550.1 glycine-rich protein family [Trichomonas vaginalis G3]|eukprot:XP_001313345.1 hypothetical protein [Trichomonas vaginalis G3]